MQPLKIYLAGPSSQRHSVIPQVAALIEATGHRLTFKWWENYEERSECRAGNQCLAGIDEADLVVCVWDEPSCGAHFEMGYATGIGKKVLVLSNTWACANSIWPWLDNLSAPREFDAIDLLENQISSWFHHGTTVGSVGR